MPIDHTRHHMICGCVLKTPELTNDIPGQHPSKIHNKQGAYCPRHCMSIKYTLEYCFRCGKEIRTHKFDMFYVTYCETCRNLLQMARTIYSQYGIPSKEFIDPFLWGKRIDEIMTEDIFVNAMLGYEEVEILEPIEFLHSGRPVLNSLEKKIHNLKQKLYTYNKEQSCRNLQA